ncbi:MAG: hypothetical protein RLY74_342 [Actinomycetota bacterium]|jgi:competence protein ComEC
MVLGMVIIQIHFLALDNRTLDQLEGQKVTAIGVVTTDPNLTRSRVIGSQSLPSRATFIMRLEEVRNANFQYKFRIPVRVILDRAGITSLHPGDLISIEGSVSHSKELRVAGVLYSKSKSIEVIEEPIFRNRLELLRVALRERVSKFNSESANLIPGMVIGDTSLQSEEFSQLMRKAGLSHLTAVSGANFAIVGTFIFSMLAFLLPNRRPRIFVTAICLVIFVLLVRPTPSVLRAALMTSSYLLAKFLGLENQTRNSLATAILLLLVTNPLQAFEPGFILSVLGTSGLIYLAPRVSEKLPGPRAIRELVSIPLSASIFCAPYLMYLSGSMNFGTILINVSVAPVVGFITILGFLATIFALPLPLIAELLIYLANLGCKWIVFVAKWSESFPDVSTSPVLIILTIFVLAVSRSRVRRIIIWLLLPLIIFSSYSALTFPGRNWMLGQCDVGQGDALLLRVGRNEAVLFDAGPDPRLLANCLENFGITYLPLIVLSHEHADHFNGISAIGLDAIGEIWLNHPFEELGEFAIKAKVVSAGYSVSVGDSKLKVIWPKRGDEIFESISGDGSLENNRSLVIKAEHLGVEILITGDIEPGAQEELLRNNDLSRIDIVKVPHHGSKYQSMNLFSSAKRFLISVGPNSYGHPNPDLLRALESIGEVERTDDFGSIAISWSGSEEKPVFSSRRLGKEWWQISWD